MSKKHRYFIIVSHCLLNPATRVHLLGRRYIFAEKVCDFFLSKHIGIIQLPCPEFTAMGYWRNPQGRQQYNNVFFRKHCRQELENYIHMIVELKNNDNIPLCFLGIQGSPTCSIHWGKHKTNKYKTESMIEDPNAQGAETIYGVMTEVLDEMLQENDIHMPYLEVPVKESIRSERSLKFFNNLYDLLDIPDAYRDLDQLLGVNPEEEKSHEQEEPSHDQDAPYLIEE